MATDADIEVVTFLVAVIKRMDEEGRNETTKEEGEVMTRLLVESGNGDLVFKYGLLKKEHDVLSETEEGDSREGSSNPEGDEPS